MSKFLLKMTAVLLFLAVISGCNEKTQSRIVLRPPTGQAAERFGTDRTGTVNFHLAQLGAALNAEHSKVVELAGRVRELEKGETSGKETEETEERAGTDGAGSTSGATESTP